MKCCSECGISKPLSEFHKAPLGKYGRIAKCKPCVKRWSHSYWATTKAKEKKRTRENKQRRRLNQLAKARQRKTPEARRAYSSVKYAVQTGKLKKQPCKRCGSLKSEAHHHNGYSNRLDVVWLCRTHHSEEHHGCVA